MSWHVPLALAAMLAGMSALPATAANFEVHMKNKGEAGAMVFEPALSKVAVGDTVTFIPTDKGHNAETIPGMMPEGAKAFKGKINQEIAVTFDAPGDIRHQVRAALWNGNGRPHRRRWRYGQPRSR